MQDRWVSYIFRYRTEDGKKCESAGYVKVTRTSRGSQDEARLRIGLKCYKPYATLCKAYLVYEDNQLTLLDEIRIPPEERDIITLEKRLPWRDFVRGGTTPKDYHGVVLKTEEGELMVANWPGRAIEVMDLNMRTRPAPAIRVGSPETVESIKALENIKAEESTKTAESTKATERVETMENRRAQPEKSTVSALDGEADSITHIINTHTKLPQLMDSPFTECVKIVPQDIGRLPIGNWKLGQNSFLTHSYYKYKYLMLGIINFDSQKKYIIGVPGVYSNKERYLANMFGFSQFVPAQRSSTNTGSFGYWVWEVLKE